MYWTQFIPKELRKKILEYCTDFIVVLKHTGLFPVDKIQLSNYAYSHINLTSYAAKEGYFSLLKWARKYGYHWDQNTCHYAAKEGHLEILIWLRENECPWYETDCLNAAANHGKKDVVMWITQQSYINLFETVLTSWMTP